MRGTSRERRARLLTVAALALAAAWTLPGSASAVIVEPLPGRSLSYQPLRSSGPLAFDKFFSNLDYNGGPVMTSNTNYTVYWDPSGGAAYPGTYRSGVNRYLEDLAHDSGGHGNVDSVSAQYNDAAGGFAGYESHFGGELLDTDPYPANGCTRAARCLTDTQLREELVKYVTAHGLPTDLAHEYFLLTPSGVEDCFDAAGHECSAGSSKPVYCAYHGNIPLSEGKELIYSNDPYVTGNAGCDDGNHPNGPSDGALEGGLSHEHNESITDPEPNNAWTDIGGTGGEIGDKCVGNMGTALGTSGGAKYNQVINGHFYWYQEEWSNQGNECKQRLTFSGEEPTATFTGAPAGGNKVNFDATGSTAPGGVSRYNWQFNDGPGLSTPIETTAPTVSHTFPEGGSYVVALTVFASDGTSIGTARTLEVGTPALPVVGKLTPKKGEAAGGTSVTITGSGFTGATQVHFGANAASSFEVLSATTIVAVSPAGTAGAADVTVTTPGGTSATGAADVFKYGKPTVTAVSPGSGPVAGGQHVTITGTGFALGSATALTFGKAKATAVECTSTTTCTTTTPAAAKAGVVDVIATAAGLKSKKSRPGDAYTYS
jgi:PKD domain/IPT/TIG domain